MASSFDEDFKEPVYVDITKEIRHRSIMLEKDKDSFETLESWIKSNRPLLHFKDSLLFVEGEFDNPKWQTFIRDCVTLCFAARAADCIVSENTFRMSDMQVTEEGELRLLRVFGKKIVKSQETNRGRRVTRAPEDISDFTSLASFIQSQVFQDNVTEELSCLLDYLRGTPTQSSQKTIILCNYYFMTDIVKINFLSYCWGLLKAQKKLKYLGNICMKYEEIDTWQAKLINLPVKDDSYNNPLECILRYGLMLAEPLYKDEKTAQKSDLVRHHVMKFIINALKHLTDKDYKYNKEQALKLVTCVYRSLIANLQRELYDSHLIGPTDLYDYFP